VDKLIAVEWADCLAEIEHRDAVAAVNLLRDSGAIEPPTPGQVYRESLAAAKRREETERSWLKMLPMGKPSEEEKARVRKLLRDLGVEIKEIG
jgi:hypothetical protein